MRIKTALFISFTCGVLCNAALAQVRPRITRPVDDTRFVRVPGTTHPLASEADVIGRASGDLPMDRMLLHLKSTPEQEAALEQLLAEQQDPQSANYHRWLSPEEFGEQFGVSQEDLDAIARWLEGHGFRVNEIARGRRSMEFSGTARQVENAFHTEIHHYIVDGVRHVANATDVAIPEALAEVVGGVASLHDFHARPLHHLIGRYAAEPGRGAAGSPAGQTDLNGGSHALSPYDFATIYDVAPLWNQNYDGTGQSIAIVADTNVKLTDVTAFRSQFGLGANNVTVVLNGPDPGTVAGEETEADLDMEWSGGVAKGAAVKLVVSSNTNTSDGITLSAQYIVNNRLAPVMSLSYGLCEAYMGAGNALYGNLWSQAAAEGISVFVSTGDSGSAGCDVPESAGSKGQNTTAPASGGFGVNGLASTPYNVAVGGTQFSDSTGTYWNTTNDAHTASAKGYIPEAVWNESSYTSAGAAANGLWAGSGGYSTVYATPAWQTGAGVPTVDPVGGGHHRYLPDVSLSGAGHDGYLVEIEGSLYLVGGTSAGAPSMAGIMAILVQRAGSWQGNPNARFYPIAAQSPSAYHDITAGTNAVPCQGGSANCSAATKGAVGVMNGFAATAGYDLATGLGSVDANALAIAWSSAPAGVTITSLSPNPMTGSSANQTLTINGSGFAAGAKVNLTYSGGPVVNPTIVSLTSTQITATVNVGTAVRTWTVQVVNSPTSSSNTANLQVNAPPAIASLSPNPMTASTANQTLIINGSGFVSGLQVNLTAGTSTTAYQSSSITYLTATQVQVTVNVGATPRTWTVQVVNPGTVASNSVTLTVAAPAAPLIGSLSPNPMTGSASPQTLTITGSGFMAGATVSMAYTGGTAVSAPVTNLTATQILATVTVGTTARTWTVQVTNPGSAPSSAANLTVSAPAAPVISSLSPSTMTASSANQFLTINGSGFQPGLTVNLAAGGTTVPYTGSAITNLTATQIQVLVNVGTTARTWTVQVVNPSAGSSNAVNLTVTAPVTPAIASLSPNPMTGSAASQTLTITGTGFQPGLTVTLTSGNTTLVQQGSFIASVTATQVQVLVTVGVTARTWTVQVTNPGNAASNTATLTVTAPAAPAITSLSPSTMTGASAYQTLTINGTGFGAGATVSMSYTGGTVVNPVITSSSATQIVASVNVGAAARSWTVQVVNPGGAASNAATLTVTAPAAPPAITSLSPNPMTGSASPQTLTINGSGFAAGLTVTLSTGASSTAYQGSYVTSISATQIQVPVIVGTTARSWTVQVSNPGGATSNVATLTVTAPAAPAIASLSPNPMTGSTANQTLTINGTGFQAGLSVTLSPGTSPNTYLSSAIASVTATQIQLSVNVGTAARSWTVQVTNPGGVSSNVATLTVTAPTPPAITSLSPNPMTGSANYQTLTINGSGFQAGAKVTLTTGNSGYTYTGGYIASATATKLQVQVNVGVTPRTWTVQVTNPDNSASTPASLTVTAPAPPPAITSLTPAAMTGSASAQTLTINGTGFQSGIIIGVEAAAANTVSVYSGSVITVTPTQLKLQINVGTTKRAWYLQLMNPDGQYSNVATWQVN